MTVTPPSQDDFNGLNNIFASTVDYYLLFFYSPVDLEESNYELRSCKLDTYGNYLCSSLEPSLLDVESNMVIQRGDADGDGGCSGIFFRNLSGDITTLVNIDQQASLTSIAQVNIDTLTECYVTMYHIDRPNQQITYYFSKNGNKFERQST